MGATVTPSRYQAELVLLAGLDGVRADAFFPITSPACAALKIATVQQIRERLVTAGLATDVEIEQHLNNVSSGRLDLAPHP